MDMTIRFSGGNRTDFGYHKYEEVILGALERFKHLVRHVQVYIEDTNGPRGGVDKQCRCVLHLRQMPPIVIQDKHENVGALIHRLAERAAYSLSQKADRKKKKSSKGATSVRRMPEASED